jgi:hypothetical protein
MLGNPVRNGLVVKWEDYEWCGIPEQIAIGDCYE